MPTRRECIHGWVTLLNEQSTDDATRFLHRDVVVAAYQQGSDGPPTTIEGIDAVTSWIRRPPHGRFVFTLTSELALDDSSEAEESQVTVSANYRVEHNESDFTNTGAWTFRLENGRIRFIKHAPRGI